MTTEGSFLPQHGQGRVSSPPDAASGNHARRRKQRDAQRRYRQQIIDEIQNLRRTVDRLRATLAKTQERALTTRPLPWKEIAAVFRSERSSSEARFHKLQTELRRWQHIATVMATWVQHTAVAPEYNLTPQLNWRHHTLPKDPTTRRLGYDWIMDQVYYNLPRFLEQSGLPASLETFHATTHPPLDDLSRGTTVVSQYCAPAPFNAVATVMQHIFYTIRPWFDVLDAPVPGTHYTRIKLFQPWDQNTVARFVLEDDRFVLMTKSIKEDELHTTIDQPTRHWLSWIVVDRVSDNCSLIRMFHHYTTWEDKLGYIPLDTFGNGKAAKAECPTNWYQHYKRLDRDSEAAGFVGEMLYVLGELASIGYN
ncbi:hypothetical protein ACHHYP_08683 [Achlya hypogyna]|uniref:BZIP domain-containing protein n=1 Tax=Achlya hypogyna TaxID=1202772 RepID=A0A1V9ZKQ6_ACHHY|nr:hypothetical protein ACHHYP_08683 [Achlya hypogyna]